MQGRAPAAPGPGPYRHSEEDPQSRLRGAATARERRSLVEIDLDVRGKDERRADVVAGADKLFKPPAENRLYLRLVD